MTETFLALLWRLSEADEPILLWGRQAACHFGPAFDRLLSSGVLEECLPAAEWHPCVDCSCGAYSRIIQLREGASWALCPHDIYRDTQLGDDDLRSFQVHPDGLVGLIADALARRKDLSLHLPGVWLIESSDDPAAIVIIPSRRTLAQSGLEGALREARRGDLLLLSPSLSAPERIRFTRAGIRTASLAAATSMSGAGKMTVTLPQKPVEEKVHPTLILYRGARRVTWGERQIVLSDQPTRLLAALIERAKTPSPHLTTRDVEDVIYGSLAPATARPGRDIIRELRDALTKGGLDQSQVKALIRREGNRGWRLDCQDVTRVEP
ncbi:MAG: hypothetical protein IOC82_12590 [Aestuariivirga sp.]|uniref:hypothetical protein n=1 Tax=Aestuariivirga sp. TaxID=2650926 RepID=UPI0025C595C9|nr:hypothetical protein [Aestuariivirga sp.]MCA3561856.1 hypothetical protein [Aestuariivirga sp.]